MTQTTPHFITFFRPTCPVHCATRMRRRLPSCIQHDSIALKDGMKSTLDTWLLNCRTTDPRNKTQSVWIKMPYPYQEVVQTQTLQLSMPCTSAATDCPVLRMWKEGPSHVPSAPSNMPCALCYTNEKTTTFLYPARFHCPQGWHEEYTGYMVTQLGIWLLNQRAPTSSYENSPLQQSHLFESKVDRPLAGLSILKE